MTFHAGNLIRQARDHRGISQAQLAELIETDQARIAEIEGQDSVTTRVLARVAEALGFMIGLKEKK